MTLELYTDILSAGILAVSILCGGTLLAWFVSENAREKLVSVSYFGYIKALGLLAVSATIFALVYQYLYDTPVCELCWWQRIFMFPIDIVALMAIIFADRKAHYSILVLAAWGLMIAAYHYYYHFSIFVMGRELTLSCSGYGTLPSCTDTPVISFGFMTIPGMAMLVFVCIIFLGILAHMVNERDDKNI